MLKHNKICDSIEYSQIPTHRRENIYPLWLCLGHLPRTVIRPVDQPATFSEALGLGPWGAFAGVRS